MTATEHSGRSRRVGPYITIGTVVVVLVAACLTLFGLGAFDRAVAVYDPSAWLFSKTKGELGRVNGGTARIDTRVKVNGTAGHQVEVSQTGRYLIVRDVDTGVVSALDLTTLQIAASLDTSPGVGVRVVVSGHAAYVVDAVRGQIRQVDPLTLAPIGATLNFAPGLLGGDFDAEGNLWIALPSEGTVVSVTPSTKSDGSSAVHTASVAGPSHDLNVSVLDKGVAVLDQTADQLVTVRGDQVVKTALTLPELGFVAPRTSGDRVPVTMPEHRQVDAVGGGSVSNFSVPGSGNGLSPAVAWAGWYYIADDSANLVYVLNQAGHLVDQIQFPGQAGDLDLQVHDDYLYINALDGATARVVDRSHKVSSVNKYPNDVPGGDTPPPPPTPLTPPAPVIGPPGAPGSVVASAGNTTAHLTWSAAPSGGSPVLRYVVEGDGRTFQVGAGQRSLDINGLTNGTSYTFQVHAVNAKGSGPKRASNPVVPTSDVPDAPAGVTAQEQKDGTVTVSWPAANGQGHRVASYLVTATGPDGPAQTWQVDGAKTTFVTPAGPPLVYGKQYAFTVITVNDMGAGSVSSPLSNSVVPYTAPAAPGNLRATTGSAAGVVSVAWAAPAANGRPITKYVVSYGGVSKDVTGATKVDLTGLADGQSVTVSVVAVNAAGNGAKAGPVTAAAIANPKLTLGKASVDYNSITVAFTSNDGGGTATCNLAISGAGNRTGSCNSSITVTGLAPGVNYGYTVTVTNEAGNVKGTGSAATTALWGTVGCVSTNGYCDSGVGIYSAPMQDTSVQTNWDGHNGKRYQAYCQAPGGDGNQQAGATLTSAGYNHNKTSSKWVKISNTSQRYIPWVWFNLDGGDDLNLLPAC